MATIGLAAAAMDTTSQGVVHIAGNPLAADVTAILRANRKIKTAFNAAAPSYFRDHGVGCGAQRAGGTL